MSVAATTTTTTTTRAAAASIMTSGSIRAAMEKTFICTDSFKLVAQCWSSGNDPSSQVTRPSSGTGHRILMLHGWLDNSSSFWKLAPKLSKNLDSADVVALDLPGHGLSSHRPQDAPSILLPEGVYYVAEVLRQLQWDTNHDNDETESAAEKGGGGGGVTLIGHSMGAAISLMYAATFPEQIQRLVLLEGAGPISKPDKDVTKHLKNHVQKRIKGNSSLFGETAKGPKTHASLEAAIETRMATAKMSPGNQYLSHEAATQMVTRATKTVQGEDGAVQFLHDYRLTWPSIMYMTHQQVETIQLSVKCPTCLLLAKDGWPFEEERLQAVKERLKPKHFAILEGSHHFHADPDSADEVAQRILEFLQQEH